MSTGAALEKAAQTLRQYLGPFGCQTRLLDYDGLLTIAKLAFDAPGRNLFDVADVVKGLGTIERSARVREAILKHWPNPTYVWPANCPVRKALAKCLGAMK